MKAKIFIFLVLFVANSFGKSTLSAQTVRAEDLRDWVSYLSSDEMRGRANGSPEMKIAADWIAKMFNEAGLKPVLADG